MRDEQLTAGSRAINLNALCDHTPALRGNPMKRPTEIYASLSEREDFESEIITGGAALRSVRERASLPGGIAALEHRAFDVYSLQLMTTCKGTVGDKPVKADHFRKDDDPDRTS